MYTDGDRGEDEEERGGRHLRFEASGARDESVGDSADRQQTDKGMGRADSTDRGIGRADSENPDQTTASAVRVSAAAAAAAAIIERRGAGGCVDIDKVAA